MAGEVFAAMYDADRLGWRPSREQARQEEQLAARRRERAARARRLAKGTNR